MKLIVLLSFIGCALAAPAKLGYGTPNVESEISNFLPEVDQSSGSQQSSVNVEHAQSSGHEAHGDISHSSGHESNVGHSQSSGHQINFEHSQSSGHQSNVEHSQSSGHQSNVEHSQSSGHQSNVGHSQSSGHQSNVAQTQFTDIENDARFGSQGSGQAGQTQCQEGEVLHVDGSCVVPQIERSYFVFNAPKQQQVEQEQIEIPPPKIKHNVVFIRLADFQSQEPIVIPPAQQKSIIYVLAKKGESTRRVIEVPAGPDHEPEVIFIEYDENSSDLDLPNGITLAQALQSAVVIEGKGLEESSAQVGAGFGGSQVLHQEVQTGFSEDQFGVSAQFNPEQVILNEGSQGSQQDSQYHGESQGSSGSFFQGESQSADNQEQVQIGGFGQEEVAQVQFEAHAEQESAIPQESHGQSSHSLDAEVKSEQAVFLQEGSLNLDSNVDAQSHGVALPLNLEGSLDVQASAGSESQQEGSVYNAPSY